MTGRMRLIEQTSPTVSPARVGPATTEPLRIAVIQHEWSSDAAAPASWLDAAIDLAAASGARIVFLPELTLSRYPADVLPGIPGADSRASRDRPDPRLRVARGTSRRGSRACFGVPASGCRRWARPQHRDRRRPAGEPRRRDRQAAPPGDGRVLRGPLFPTGIRRQPLSRLRVQRVRRVRWRPLRPADLLGRVVSGGRARVFARRREHRGVSDGQRFGARPSGLRYPAALAEGDHWQRHRERSFHGRSAPVRPGERMQP